MGGVEFAAIRPFLVFGIGMISDYLIAKGFLMPDQRQMWVEGWTQIISASGGVVLSALLLIHEIKRPHQKQNSDTINISNVTQSTPVSATQPTAPLQPTGLKLPGSI